MHKPRLMEDGLFLQCAAGRTSATVSPSMLVHTMRTVASKWMNVQSQAYTTMHVNCYFKSALIVIVMLTV